MTTETVLDVGNSVLGKHWCLQLYDEMHALGLTQKYSIPEILGRILASRGFDMDTAENFLNPSLKSMMPDPSHLLDMDKAVDRIVQAIQNSEKIAVFGDYDVDGATSSAVLFRFFKSIGIELRIYIPDRVEEGYGPNPQAFDKLKSEGISVVVTVDCGTTSHAAIDHANSIGLDIIVIDHHDSEATLPEAFAVVNPNRQDETSPLKTLAAVGLSFVLIVALNRKLRGEGWYKKVAEPDLRYFLDLVALGTVCDVMPLTGLNRAYVAQGLKIMAHRRNQGIKALCDIADLHEPPSVYHLGFVLGPRINAGGRIGQANLGAQLLCCDDAMQAMPLAVRLDELNVERKLIEAQVLEEAIQQITEPIPPLILVSGKGWHPGVIGIVAGRLKEKYGVPTCVVAIDDQGIGKGSGRSIAGVDLGSLMRDACHKGILIVGGGHAAAAGFTVAEDKIDELHNFFLDRCKQNGQYESPKLMLDGILPLGAITIDFVNLLERLGPYGVGNPMPRFAFSNIRVTHSKVVGNDHVSCTFGQLDGARLAGIAFRSVTTDLGQTLLNNNGVPLHVVGTLRLNNWQGKTTVQLFIEDIAKSQASLSKAG